MSIVINGASNDILLNGISVTTDAESAASLALKANVVSPTFTGTPTINGEVMGGSYGFKNYIINGNFDVWQYKNAGLTYPQTSSGYGSDDRWLNANFGSTKTHSQVTATDTERALFNASYFSRTVVSSVAGANNFVLKQQAIENVTRLAGKTVTLSFWAKADASKNIAVEFTQAFGTGGTPSSAVTGIGSQLLALTTAWKKFTVTLTLPSLVGKTLGTDGPHTSSTGINFWFDVGSSYNTRSSNLGQQSGTFDIAQVQIEEGSIATPFEQRPIGLELSLCQRYYEVIQSGASYYKFGTGYVENTTQAYVQVPFKVTKRIIPTILFSGAFATVPTLASTSPSADNQSINGFSVLCTGTGFVAGQARTLIANGDTSASIIISSEI